MTKSIDEWAADKCGVVFGYVPNYNGHGTNTWAYKGVTYYWRWTIKDPRCREVVREHFWLSTTRAGNSTALMDGKYWSCSSSDSRYRRMHKLPIKGKSHSEAEIACITAIYEAETGSEE